MIECTQLAHVADKIGDQWVALDPQSQSCSTTRINRTSIIILIGFDIKNISFKKLLINPKILYHL